jgi:hypothetical protein
MESLHLSSTLSINPEVVYTHIENDLVMMDPNGGGFYSMNSVGTDLWNRLVEKPATLESIYYYLKERYEVSEEQLREDIEEFIQTMITQNMVVVSN